MAGEGAADPSAETGREQLTALVEVAGELFCELELDGVLERTLAAAREITGAPYAALGVLNRRGGGFDRFLYLGIDERTRRKIGDLPRARGLLGVLIEDAEPLRIDRVGDHPRSFGFPRGHPPMESLLGVPVIVGGEPFAILYLTDEKAGRFDATDEKSVSIIAAWASIAIERSRLYTAARDRRAELEQAIRGLEATTEIARAVGGETDLARILETIAKRGRALVEARSVIILLEESGELEVVIAAGDLDRDVSGERIPFDSPWGQACRDGLPRRIDTVDAGPGPDPAQLGPRAEAALLAPLTFRGRGLGLIIALDRLRGGPAFDADDEALLLSFAASAATAVATAQSVAEERVRFSIEASERERSKWASELHDETLQGLGALRVTLSAALKGDGHRLAATAEAAVAQLADEIATLRSLIAELRPVALDELGLEAAVESLIERHSATGGVEIDARLDLGAGASRRLDPEIESSIYRVVQEALTNVAKHARAEHVELEIAREDGWVTVKVSDDGVGFDAAAPGGGFGLRGMRERTALVNGTMTVRSARGSGTEIELEIPATVRPLPRVSVARTRDAGAAEKY